MAMTSAQRVIETLSQRLPDRVAYFLPVTMHGALEVGVPVGQYFQSARLVAEGQMRLRAKYRDDIVYPFFYGAIEHQAFGGEVDFPDDGPPNAVAPLLTTPAQVRDFCPPQVADSPILGRVLDAISLLADRVRGEALIVGVVMSPGSLPVMQLGFDGYFDLIEDHPAALKPLLRRNLDFTIQWANAQLAAGADAIGYFDPMTSSTVVSPALAGSIGMPLMQTAMSAINGPCAALFASGRCLDLLPRLRGTPAAIVGVGHDESLREAKELAGGITVMGNLNGIQMRRWSPQQARLAVRDAIAQGAPGGRFILSDAHGEIPIQVPGSVLMAISDAVEEFGHYPQRQPDGELGRSIDVC